MLLDRKVPAPQWGDGDEVGTLVGLCVGSGVGSGEGSLDGIGTGRRVGAPSGVGRSVGCGVGCWVGWAGSWAAADGTWPAIEHSATRARKLRIVVRDLRGAHRDYPVGDFFAAALNGSHRSC